MGTQNQDDMEPYQLKRKVLPGHIDVHPTDNAIVVNYTIQATIIGENGPVMGDKKAMQKTIRIKSLNAQTNLSSLAEEVVEKCKLIHPSKVRDIEQLLYYLQQRHMNDGGNSGTSENSWIRKQMEGQRTMDGDPIEEASMDAIEQYIEGLYEEIPEKIHSTRVILQLARVPENMDTLIGNDALISALSRVLREDGKKSMELITNIIYIFFCFSNFSQYHSFITTNKVGDMCLKITDQELARFALWVQDLTKLEVKAQKSPETNSIVKELENEHAKFQAMIRKQDQLLFVSFHLLLNLAEDLNIEVKMLKRDIVKYLITMLDRGTPELLILVVTFLKKLSIFKENKDEILKRSDEFLPKVNNLLLSEHQGLQNLTLRLLLNLSYDQNFRAAMLKHGFLLKFVEILQNKSHLLVTLQLLYQISIDDAVKPAFANTELLPLMMRLILEYKGERVNADLMALAINITTNLNNTVKICDDNGLKFLMKRALKYKDSLMLKMIRNMASQEGQTKMLFLDYIDDLMHILLKNTNSPEILVEILGILSSINIPDFDFAKLADAYQLLPFIEKRLEKASKSPSNLIDASSDRGGNTQLLRSGLTDDDDITLELIIFVGTMCNDEGIAPIIAKTNIISTLLDIMTAKEEDDEIILQIIYVVYQMLLYPPTRNILLNKTQIVSYLIDLLYDRNVEIRKMCDACLDIISEIDEEWMTKIRHQKFHWHNSEWMASITQQPTQNIQENEYEEDAVLYSNKKLMETSQQQHQLQLQRHRDSSNYGYGGNNDDYNDVFASDSEDEAELFRGGLIGGTSALLDGP